MEVRTRFAPSPSGHLHVGGARTALFNWLYTKQHGGKFLLRIEDTDASRSDRKIVQEIINDLQWLGIDWDEEIIYQSQRLAIYPQYAQKLFETDHAYLCFCTPEELKARRKAGEKTERTYLYDGKCRRLSKEQVKKNIEKKLPYAIRFKTPQGSTRWVDGIHDEITIRNDELDDFILQRSDGTPTYQLAVVVDDHEMNTTDVIRGDDHISNTPKQILLYEAFGWQIPKFTHIPLILGPDNKRLSKRHGATAIGEYRDKGYLSKALLNYLALLGWSPGDDSEIMTLQKLEERFTLEGISKKGAIFDETKLMWMNGHYIREMSNEEILPHLQNYLQSTKRESASDKAYLTKVIRLMRERVKLLSDFVDSALYFFEDPKEYDPKGINKYLKTADKWMYITEFTDRLANLSKYDENNIEALLRSLAEEKNISAAKIIHPVRLALTGKTASPGLFEMMEILGKDTVIRRLRSLISQKEDIMKHIDVHG